MAMPGIVIRVSAATKDAISDLGKVNRALGQTATTSQKANAVMAKGAKIAGAALAGAAVAAGALAVKLGVEGVEAAIDDQAAQKKLAQALKNNGFAAYTAQVEDTIDAMMQATGVADDELRPAYAQLLAVTKDMAQTEQLMAAAMDLAAAKGIPLEQAVKAVSKAAAGSATALSRIAPELGKIDTKGDAAAATLTAINKQFGGQQAVRAGTYAGQIQKVGTAWDEVVESFGTGFIGDIEQTDGAMGDLAKTLYDSRTTVEDLGTSLRDLLGVLIEVAEAANTVKGAIDSIPGGEIVSGWGGPFQLPLHAIDQIKAGIHTLQNPQLSAGGASTDVYTPTVDYNPVLWQQKANVAAARATGRAAQKQARTGSRP